MNRVLTIAIAVIGAVWLMVWLLPAPEAKTTEVPAATVEQPVAKTVAKKHKKVRSRTTAVPTAPTVRSQPRRDGCNINGECYRFNPDGTVTFE